MTPEMSFLMLRGHRHTCLWILTSHVTLGKGTLPVWPQFLTCKMGLLWLSCLVLVQGKVYGASCMCLINGRCRETVQMDLTCTNVFASSYWLCSEFSPCFPRPCVSCEAQSHTAFVLKLCKNTGRITGPLLMSTLWPPALGQGTPGPG